MGRVLGDSDDRDSAPPVAVMSYHAWVTKYGKDTSLIGAAIQINSKPFTVIRIAAPGFFGANMGAGTIPDFWMPLSQEPVLEGETSRLKTPDSNWLDIIGRVRPGTDPKALEAQLKTELRQWQVSHLADMTTLEKEYLPKQQFHLTPGSAGVTGMREYYKDSLRLLLAAASCVLLIACANLANLLPVRGLKNRQQTSVRVALGASRGRLVRNALIESMVQGLLGGAAGLGVAFAGTSLILRLAFTGPNSCVPIDAAPSLPVLLFALGLSLLTGVLFGVAPAWMTSHAQPIEALRDANRSAGQKTKSPQRALVIGQAAISLVLLSAAANHGAGHREFAQGGGGKRGFCFKSSSKAKTRSAIISALTISATPAISRSWAWRPICATSPTISRVRLVLCFFFLRASTSFTPRRTMSPAKNGRTTSTTS
jgi:MacB-like periplasmic core domain/FtsX-like permease family